MCAHKAECTECVVGVYVLDQSFGSFVLSYWFVELLVL